jgi:hypothetical protein
MHSGREYDKLDGGNTQHSIGIAEDELEPTRGKAKTDGGE